MISRILQLTVLASMLTCPAVFAVGEEKADEDTEKTKVLEDGTDGMSPEMILARERVRKQASRNLLRRDARIVKSKAAFLEGLRLYENTLHEEALIARISANYGSFFATQ